MERFLRYSLEHDRAIRVILMHPDGKIRQVNAVVEAMEGDQVRLYIIRPPQRLTLPIRDLLSAANAAGDEG